MKSESRKIDRNPAEEARLRSIRERFQCDKPSLKRLVESGEAFPPMPLGVYLKVKALLRRLKRESESAGP